MFPVVWMAVAVTLVALAATGWRALRDLDLLASRLGAQPVRSQPEQGAVIVALRVARAKTVA